MSRIQAHRLIGATAAANNVSATVDIKPANERQVRPLTKLPAYQQPEAWAKAVEAADGKVSLAIELNQIIEPVPI